MEKLEFLKLGLNLESGILKSCLKIEFQNKQINKWIKE